MTSMQFIEKWEHYSPELTTLVAAACAIEGNWLNVDSCYFFWIASYVTPDNESKYFNSKQDFVQFCKDFLISRGHSYANCADERAYRLLADFGESV